MAGFYPDYPNHRFGYESDGTEGVRIDPSNVITSLNNSVLVDLNRETDVLAISFNDTGTNYLAFIFPEMRDLTGHWVTWTRSGVSGDVDVQTSVDTTNGLDGTWVDRELDIPVTPVSKPGYRDSITTYSAPGCLGFRLRVVLSGGAVFRHFYAVHVFGTYTSGENPDRLNVWHPTSDLRVGPAYFDFGDLPRDTSGTLTFRVKNQSATLTADDITVSLDFPTDASPSLSTWLDLSDDGTNFGASVLIDTLAPGAISSVLTLRRQPPVNAQLFLWTYRVKADPLSMT